MANSRTINVFLGSSNELMNDRNSFSDLIRSLDDIYEPRGIRVKLKRWENFFAYCTGNRTQDQYNKVLTNCDISICIFHRIGGKFTIEEFEKSVESYQLKHSPKPYVYVRALVDGEVEEEALTQFKKDLYEKMGHYWCNYATDDTMKLHFVMQFEQLLNEGMPSWSQGSNIKVERGIVMLHGKKIADYANLPFASENSDMKNLKEKIAALDKDIAELRASNVETLSPMIDAKLAERYECQKQVEQLEKQLLDMALSISKMISSGEPINERRRLAIEMFEKGNHQAVDNILNAQDIKADCERSNNKIAMIEQKMAEFNALMAAEKEAEIQRLRSSVDDYVLKAQNLMTMYSNPNRFKEACHWYEEAINETRKGLPKEDLAEQLFEYARFLHENNQFHRVEEYYKEVLEICEYLAKAYPKAYESYVATTLNNLADLYYNTQRFNESEAYYLRALEMYERLTSTHPEAYESDVAMTLNNLAVLYKYKRRFNESEAYYLRALEIYERLASAHPEAYESKVATTLNNLANLYSDTQRLNESEAYFLRALEIRERLASAHPEAYESDVAMTLNNLAVLYSDTQRFNESEAYYLRALDLYFKLADSYPDVYENEVARTAWNLYRMYHYDMMNQIAASEIFEAFKDLFIHYGYL